MTIEWQWRRLEDLTAKQLYALFSARSAVFVVEQNCPYQDLDGADIEAEHLIAWSGDEVAACLRLLAPGVKFTEVSIGRVLTTRAFRTAGLGRELMARGLVRCDQQYPSQAVRIGAQAHLERFYGEFGFIRASDAYMEDGIPHIEMVRAPRK
ncbi:MAG: GNAT family N-acetyltransferase [Steroidobacter sp.]